jgi:putative tryptophan/tyrosine transport system substrate-binding protein
MRKNCWAVLVGLALTILSISAGAETPATVHRIGYLSVTSGVVATALRDGLIQAIAQRGYSVGRDLLIESRSAEGQMDRLPSLAKELVASRVEVVVALSEMAARAVTDDTATVAIIAVGVPDPVESGLVASLNRPGGNITGVSDMAAELSSKRLGILKDVVPGLKRVAMLWNANDPGMTQRYRAAAAAAASLGVAMQALGVREPDDFDAAFAAMTHEMPDGILMVTDALTALNRKRVFEFAAAHRVPAIYEFEFLARDGGLMAYGPDGKEWGERVADLVERILKGAKPADLPFEQPTRFQFVINLKTAKALGLTVPPLLLATADEVIE